MKENMNFLNEPKSFSLIKLQTGELMFNITGGQNNKEAVKELITASIQIAIQQGYVTEDVTSIADLILAVSSEEEKQKFYSSLQKKRERNERKRFSLDQRTKKIREEF